MKEQSGESGRLLFGLGIAALATAGSYGATRGAYELLEAQARVARRIIPRPTTWPFNGDGIYRPESDEPEPWRPGAEADIHLTIFGDSLAAGLGASSRAELPGVLLAKGLAEESGHSVRLSTKAIVGATSKSLFSQVEAMQIAGGTPDIAVILIGGNDVTAKHGIGSSARRLGEAVRVLVDSGAQVVVGTCPDLGVVRPVPQPLRTLVHSWSLRLADAQSAQVRNAGGLPVSLAETLAPELIARPEALFSHDQFHPNSAGYELAAGILLPAVCVALGIWPDIDSRAAAPTRSPAALAPLRAEKLSDAASASVEAPTTVGTETDVEAALAAEADASVSADASAAADEQASADSRKTDGRVVEQLLGRLVKFTKQHEAEAGGEAGRAVTEFFRLSRFRKAIAAARAAGANAATKQDATKAATDGEVIRGGESGDLASDADDGDLVVATDSETTAELPPLAKTEAKTDSETDETKAKTESLDTPETA